MNTRKLTQYQKEFIVDTFFPNTQYGGWKTIATKLVDTGKCIIAGTNTIWSGGIGNFIDSKPAEDAVDCTELSFGTDVFLSSAWYRENKEVVVPALLSEIDRHQKKLDSLRENYSDIINL